MLWLEGIGPSCPRLFPLSSPGVLARDSASSHGDLIFKTDILYPYGEIVEIPYFSLLRGRPRDINFKKIPWQKDEL